MGGGANRNKLLFVFVKCIISCAVDKMAADSVAVKLVPATYRASRN